MDNIETVKIGTVESVDEDAHRAKVRFEGKNTSSSELTILDNTRKQTEEKAGGSGYALYESHKHEIKRWAPEVGDRVVCLMIPDGYGQGFIVGAI